MNDCIILQHFGIFSSKAHEYHSMQAARRYGRWILQIVGRMELQ